MSKNNKTHRFIVIAIFATAIVARLIVGASLLAAVAKSGELLDEYMAISKPTEKDPVFDCYHALPKSREEKGTAMDNFVPIITEDSADMYKNEIAAFTKAIAKDGKNACLFLERGKLYLDSGLHDKALADFSKAIEINPKDAEIYDWRGTAYQRLSQDVLSNSFVDIVNCPSCKPPSEEAVSKTMNEYYKKAIEDYSRALKLEPDEPYFYHRRAVMYMGPGRNGDYENAIKDYEKAISLAPDDIDLLISYSESMYEIGDKNKAIEIYTKALASFPENADLLAGRGTIYNITNELDKAIEDYTKALDIDNEHYKARWSRAKLYMRMSDYKSAIADYTAFIKQGDKRFYSDRADAKMKLGDFDGAISDYNQAEKTSKNPENEIYGKSQALMAKNDFLGAADECSKILKKYPYALMGEARTCRCEALYKMEKYEQAETECKKAIPFNSGYSSIKAADILKKIQEQNK